MVRKRSRAHAAATSTRPFRGFLPTPQTDGSLRVPPGQHGALSGALLLIAGGPGFTGAVCVGEARRALPVQMGGRSHGRRTKGSIIGVTCYLPVQARTLGH